MDMTMNLPRSGLIATPVNVSSLRRLLPRVRIVQFLRRWLSSWRRRRRQARDLVELEHMDDAQLRDIGLLRADVIRLRSDGWGRSCSGR
jgi:uncharacterized protein YjiS (DUF1127 family)